MKIDRFEDYGVAVRILVPTEIRSKIQKYFGKTQRGEARLTDIYLYLVDKALNCRSNTPFAFFKATQKAQSLISNKGVFANQTISYLMSIKLDALKKERRITKPDAFVLCLAVGLVLHEEENSLPHN